MGNGTTTDSSTRVQVSNLCGVAGSVTTTYQYDGDGNRASKTVGGTTTNFAYDVNASLPNVLTDGVLKYVYGLGLAYAVDGSGNVQVYHTDGLGSVRAITDGSGSVVATYTTDEFGIPTQTQGSSTQSFQYTGQQRDAEDGLYYLRARMYEPSIGRFLSRDSVFGSVANPLSLNGFTYALDNPLLMMDPSGLSANRVTQDPCSDPMNLLHWFCGDSAVRMNPFGVVRMNPFDRDILNALEGAVGGEQTEFSTSSSTSSSSTSSNSRRFFVDPTQLQEKFKHAPDFGIIANWNTATAKEFEAALRSHVQSAGTQEIIGTYRKMDVIHYFDPVTQLNVITDRAGNFITTWRLNPTRIKYLLSAGKR